MGLQLAIDIGLITYLSYQNGGIESHSPFLFTIPILASGVAFRKRAMFTTAASIAVVYSCVMTAQFYGWISSTVMTSHALLNDPQAFYTTLVFIDSTILLVAVVGTFFIGLLQNNAHDLEKAKHKTSHLLHEQKTEEEAYRVRQEALFDSIGEGLVVVNEYGNVINVNSVAEKILGYKKEELQDVWFPKALPAVDDKDVVIEPKDRPLVRALETGKPVSSRMRYVNKNGEHLPVFMTATPFIVNGKPSGGVVVFRDYSHETKIEQAKDEFISIVSHQLRTPLTAIRLFTEMILGNQVGTLKPAQRDYLTKVEQSTLRMIALVGNILNVSRLELGRLKVEPEPTQLEELIKGRIDEATALAKAKKVALDFKAPSKPLPMVKLDQSLIGEVIHNLLTNAIRYSPADTGKVEVSVSKESNGYIIKVSDNGIGIPKEAQSKMFTRFFRADNAIKVEGEGTGLGLYLIKMVIETVDGKVWFESKENKGTTFYVRIPLTGMKPRAGDRKLATGGNI
jgi:PAS domain S-box-containing protein